MSASLLSALLWSTAGAVIGSLYWLTLRWTTEMFAVRGALARALAAQVTRFAALGAMLVGVAIRGGALALLASAGGLMVARAAALCLVRRD